ncbi:MAG TPA: hypothetical protein VIU46_06440 [Gallionellaceae bacterium]
MKIYLMAVSTLILAACESAPASHSSGEFEQHQISCSVVTPTDCEKVAWKTCGCNPEETTTPCSKFEKIDWNKPGLTDAHHVLVICKKSQ